MSYLAYVETSIASFYYEKRSEPEMIARRQWTREWWALASREAELVTSEAVLDELDQGTYDSRERCLLLLADVPLLPVAPPLQSIVETYIARGVMPADPVGDALHLALASFYRCDFLVTWNCRHLANANKVEHIRIVNGLLGIHVPALVTPLQLLAERDDEA